MHSAQVLEMFVQMHVQGVSKSCKKCFISMKVLQNSYAIQWCPRSVQVVEFERTKSYACADTDHVCLRFRPEKNSVLPWLGRSPATWLSSLCRDLNEPRYRSTYLLNECPTRGVLHSKVEFGFLVMTFSHSKLKEIKDVSDLNADWQPSLSYHLAEESGSS